MNYQRQKEEKSRVKAAIYTFCVHAAILFLMFFIIAMRVPNPPFPGSGIELNFGTDAEGSGDIQPEEPVGTEAKPDQKQEESKPEEVQQTKEETPVVKQEEVKPVETKQKDQELVTSHEESPMVVKEKKEEIKKPVEQPVKEKVEEKPQVEEKPLAVYKAGANKNEDKSDASGKAGKPGNQGDDKDKTGDKGNPQGTLDSKAMYGNPGSGNGGSGGAGGPAALDLNGWQWDNIPNPDIPNNETGRIVFEIEVDDNGELIKYTKISSTISAGAERACIAAIDKLTFSKKAGAKVPAVSKGRITFVVRAQ